MIEQLSFADIPRLSKPPSMAERFVAYLAEQNVTREDVLKFLRYHEANTAIWEAFEAAAIRRRNDGERGSAKLIMEVDVRAALKISVRNAATSYYARMFNFKHGCEYFEMQRVRGFKEAA